jgi:Tfp pilus assembly protein PilP
MGKWFDIGLLLIMAVLVSGVPVPAQEEATEEATEEFTVEKRVYEYDAKGRRDPFVSLIREEEGPLLTGNPLLDNDVSQMRVVAIVWEPGDRYALFGLPDGKYYTIKEGMQIGLHGGEVEEILEDSVLVREQKPDFRGELRPVDSYLRLRKEEGQ